MTREEAKRILEFDLDHIHNDESKAALRIAIKALEQEPCEDAISRQDAILQIQRHGIGCFDPDEFIPEQCERFVISILEKLPSVVSQSKPGKWITKTYYTKFGDSYFGYECNNCHKEYDLKTNFCPNCGCRMEE